MAKSKSPAFARIRAEVLAATCAIPRGRVTTYGTIAQHLEVVPRHVAFVLAALTEAEAEVIPWHRVVATGGVLRIPSAAGRRRQRKRLADEGVAVSRAGKVADFPARVHRWPTRADHPGQPARGPYSDPRTTPLFPEAIQFGYPLSF